MSRDFYPFVEDGQQDGASAFPQAPNASTPEEDAIEPRHPARIAVYDDAAAAPRVVVVEPSDVRTYLEEITATVNRLSHEQGGTIPFMVIREIVENFIHAYFQAPTITILDGGNTIRFSDQGPGIREKDLALEYGTTSATEEMKHYIRGVGSGLPYAQQYMADKGGSLQIEDNIQGGTVVTISTHPAGEAREVSGGGTRGSSYEAGELPGAMSFWQQPYASTAAQAYAQTPYGQAPYGQAPYQQGYVQPVSSQQPWAQPQQIWLQQGYAQAGAWQQAPSPQTPAQMPYQQSPANADEQGASFSTSPTEQAPSAMPQLGERGQLVMDYLAEHELCGPTDLTRACGFSGPTWSRELNALANAGLVIKDGQKYRLTTLGRAYL